jgi:hypothetical protein
VGGDIRPVLLGGSQAVFLYERPSRLSVDQIVVSEPGSMPRATNSSRISANVIPLRLIVSTRSNPSWPASRGLR